MINHVVLDVFDNGRTVVVGIDDSKPRVVTSDQLAAWQATGVGAGDLKREVREIGDRNLPITVPGASEGVELQEFTFPTWPHLSIIAAYDQKTKTWYVGKRPTPIV